MREWASGKGWTMVMIRTDHPQETALAPMGGYMVASSELPAQMSRLCKEGRVVLAMMPQNKYDNLRGINTEFDGEAGLAWVEIVGPGFDVSDLNRGNVAPHEVWQFTLNDDGNLHRGKRLHLVDHESYIASVDHRLHKIGRELVRLQQIPEREVLEQGYQHAARAWLESKDYSRLLRADRYEPTPDPVILQLRRDTRGLGLLLPIGRSKSACLPSSVIPGTESLLTYWDIVDPAKKYARFGGSLHQSARRLDAA